MTIRRVLFHTALSLLILLGGVAPAGALDSDPGYLHRQADEDEPDEDLDDSDSEADETEGEIDEDGLDEKLPGDVPEADTDVDVQKLSPSELREMEERLEVLRDQVFKSRAKLRQLRDQLILSSVSVINAAIYYNQEHSGAFKLLTTKYTLDGFVIFEDVNTDGHLNKVKELKIYEGSLLPGEHLLVVDLYYRGKGFGLFSYLNSYTFQVKSRYSFLVEEGQAFDLNVTAYDKTEFLAPLKERLKVKFIRESRDVE